MLRFRKKSAEMIKDSSILALKNELNIVQIISQYLTLKKMGRNFGALCPFHDEKTPSFMVSPTRNAFHCFGCGKHGDAITFVMEFLGLNFIAAIERLAELNNFALEYENSAKNQDLRHDQSALSAVFGLYQKMLSENPAAQKYLKNRGVDPESIQKFSLGFCENSARILKFCQQNNMNIERLLDLGILGRDGGRTFAKFLDRLIFPIFGASGKPIGLGGRTLKDDVAAKYINSQASYLFNKSRELYALHLAREAIFREGTVILCEGYLDVILMHQAGFSNTVATLGTSFTNDHAARIQKLSARVILTYDGDVAGQNAAFKAAQILKNFDGGVAILPENSDPCDLIASGQRALLAEKISNFMPFLEFLLKKVAKTAQNPGQNPHQAISEKQKILEKMAKILENTAPLVKNHYAILVAELLNVTEEAAKNALKTTAIAKNVKIFAPDPKRTPLLPQKSDLEAAVLKNILTHTDLLDFARENLDERLFVAQKTAFQALKNGDFENPALIFLQINEAAPEKNDFMKNVLHLCILRAREEKIRVLADENLNFVDKNSKAMALQKSIKKLRSGEFVKIFSPDPKTTENPLDFF